ncbi:MarR family transcriptional regulator [Streptomyces hygroscopicus]|uniref:MarR family transcriptional regulator n=1 Tax=Streptomyces hygroscopicus TaxID=1912 RepID=UPI00131DAC89|nr:MarR family transcriptional regulator [Streptomyces hygroscopicus]
MPTTTNTGNTTTTTNQPDPAQLSGATAAVWAALNNQPGTTSTALAQVAGVGRSTTTKALRHFERTGLARRESAAPDGSGRPVNYWYPTPTPDPDTSTSPDTTDESPTADNDSHESPTEHHDRPAPTAESPASEDDASEHGDADEDGERCTASEPSEGVENDDAPAPTPASEPPTSEAASEDTKTEETQPTVNQTDYRTRLAPGALRQMVVGHLTAHPDEAFTATRISRIIEKSSGAIANALVTLTKQGIAEQVTERPRTYRITTAATRNGEA